MPANTIGSTAKQAWTPGPWHVDGNDINFLHTDEVGNRTSGTVAEVYQRGERKFANAKLIAKAPEMAEALTALLLINENHPRYKQESENALRILREAGAL